MGRWSGVAVFPVSEAQRGWGGVEAVLALPGLALQGLSLHLGPSAPPGLVGTRATQSVFFCSRLSVLEPQK